MLYEDVPPDAWDYGAVKSPKTKPLDLGEIPGVLPFEGVRNPSGRSTMSHRVFFTIRTPRDEWCRRVAIAECAAEWGVMMEAQMSPNLWHLTPQPFTVQYRSWEGPFRQHTLDNLITFRSGQRRALFVRNKTSLLRVSTQLEITDIRRDVLKGGHADEMLVICADQYHRRRLANVHRQYIDMLAPDHEADAKVLAYAHSNRRLLRVSDLLDCEGLNPARVMAACNRLVAHKKLKADMNAVFCEHSQVAVA